MAILDACNRRIQQAHDLAATQAWLTAALQRAKRLPELKKMLGKSQVPKPQSPEELLANVRRLKSMFGGRNGRS
jgi:hypothetical protein